MAGGAGNDPPATSWRWPLGPPVPAVVRGFSPPTSPWLPGHRGVDLAASPGDPVYAAGSGRVSYSGALAGRGVVAITHGELRTTYLPVRPAVLVGQDVLAGARIGTIEAVQASPHCTQACLHWGLLRGATYLDPLALVRPIVRLLPLWQSKSAPDLHGAPAPGEPMPSPGLRPPPERRFSRDGERPSAPGGPSEAPTTGKHRPPHGDRPSHPALRGASSAAAGALTCLVLALSLAFVRRSRTRPRSSPPEPRLHHRPPPNVIDLAHERRLRRPPATQHHR
ncbi:M23 family metallopeptidase [Actinomadura harenae]